MTDEQIIKALGFCGNIVDSTCKGCVYHETYNASCVVRLMRDALDLINRQKAENEMLKDLITYQKQEIKEKEQKYNQAVDDMFGLIETTRKEIAEAKSEAIKKFAERLKEKGLRNNPYGGSVDNRDIDNLVKEMVGEKDG